MMAAAAVACATADDAAPTGERQALGKADNVGSCLGEDGEDACGGKSDGNCWCDESCQEYGDCCADMVDVCLDGGGGGGGGPQLCMNAQHCDEGEYCDHSQCLSNCQPRDGLSRGLLGRVRAGLPV